MLFRGKYTPSETKVIESESIKFSDNITEYFSKASLIICHCGAGTLLECLKLEKKIVAVVNNTLADNHQLELFEELEKGRYLAGFRDINEITVERLREIIKMNN